MGSCDFEMVGIFSRIVDILGGQNPILRGKVGILSGKLGILNSRSFTLSGKLGF